MQKTTKNIRVWEKRLFLFILVTYLTPEPLVYLHVHQVLMILISYLYMYVAYLPTFPRTILKKKIVVREGKKTGQFKSCND